MHSMILIARGTAAIFPRRGDFKLSRMLRRCGVLASALLLAGCPLFGGQDKSESGSSNNPAFAVVLEGDGVSKAGPLAFRVDLVSSVALGQALKLSASLDDKPVVPSPLPASSASGVVRVDAADRLTALKPGNVRITVNYGDNRAELAITVKSDASTAIFKAINPVVRGPKGPVDAFITDNFKYGNGGIWGDQEVWVTIIGPGGKAIPTERCEMFGARVTPDQMPSGWANDDREYGGIVDFQNVVRGLNTGAEGMPGCGFEIAGSGFPIIGSGVQLFQLDIYWACLTKFELPECGTPGYPPCAETNPGETCGKPLPGGTVSFGIRRQGPDECDYCEGRK
jgi:hypothetical protein